MNDHFWLSDEQLKRIDPYFPLSHGVPRMDDQRVISGIIHVLKCGLQWRDAPKEYGPHKTLYNRFVRWSKMGVFDKIFAGLAADQGVPDQLQIDATHLKAHRTAASLLNLPHFVRRDEERGCSPSYRANKGRIKIQTSCCLRWSGATSRPAFIRRANERLQRG